MRTIDTMQINQKTQWNIITLKKTKKNYLFLFERV